MPSVHIIIKGKVQGVFYRVSAKAIADQLLITGWIRNTIDGDVEAMVTGSKLQLQQFIDWCRKGPAKADVTTVIATEVEDIIFNDFCINRR